MASDRREYLAVMRDPKRGFLFGVFRGQKLLGYFALFIYRSSLADARAGTSLTFDFSIQGRGIAQTAYRIMLEEMKRRRVRSFHGGTSQPAVLGLAKIMRRKTVSYLLRYKKS